MVIKEQLGESQGICEYAVYVQGPSVCFAYFCVSVAESDWLWSPYAIGQTIIFSCCGFYLLLSSFFPRLISAAAHWMSTILPHMVWP